MVYVRRRLFGCEMYREVVYIGLFMDMICGSVRVLKIVGVLVVWFWVRY